MYQNWILETSDVAIAPVQVNHVQKPAAAAPSSKEFDPLSSQKSVEDTQNNVMSSFGISNDGELKFQDH